MLKITNLSKTYGKNQVLCDVNLEIYPGEIYGLLGPNGAGKTTTLNIICNLIKPSQGTVTINNQPICQKTKYLLGIAPQENLLYSGLTCRENLNFYAKIYGLKRKERHQRIEDILNSVSLWEKAQTPVENLSSGMQKKLNIAIALVHHPKILILDEPTNALDIESRFEIWQLIEKLREQKITILLTTHLLDEAQRLCQRVGIIKNGQILVQGSLNQLRQLIPAREILLIETTQEQQAIALGNQAGFTHKRYGNQLAFWLPKHLELKEIISIFSGISIQTIARQSIQLEHIYMEIMEKYV